MFGWFAPKCPLELSQKVWTEYRMRWLCNLIERSYSDRMWDSFTK